MTRENAFERLVKANPVPASMLEPVSDERGALLVAITERTAEMQTRDQNRIGSAPVHQRKRWAIAAAVVLATMLAAGLIAFLSQDPPVADSPLTLVDRFIDSMNGDDVDGALGLLSAETACDLPTPTGGVETCEEHLGYLNAIGTRFDQVSCRDTAPYRCTFELTSALHETLGYPDHTLRMSTVFALDEDGLIVADLFADASVTEPYFPGDDGEFWVWMAAESPDIDIDPVFGPDVYDRAAGEAAMAAARSFTAPARVVGVFQDRLESYDGSGMGQCNTPDGGRSCGELLEFLAGIDARLTLDCDAEAATSEIPCRVTIDSDVHRALGTAASTGALTVRSRGGRVTGFDLDLAFSADPALHQDFMGFAKSNPELYGARPIWTSASAPAWVEAAETYVED